MPGVLLIRLPGEGPEGELGEFPGQRLQRLRFTAPQALGYHPEDPAGDEVLGARPGEGRARLFPPWPEDAGETVHYNWIEWAPGPGGARVMEKGERGQVGLFGRGGEQRPNDPLDSLPPRPLPVGGGVDRHPQLVAGELDGALEGLVAVVEKLVESVPSHLSPACDLGDGQSVRADFTGHRGQRPHHPLALVAVEELLGNPLLAR